jgi:hypothetical protein
LRIVFADVKSANTSICICLVNNLFAHADAKKMPKYCQSSPNMVCVEPLFPTTQGSYFYEISPTITFLALSVLTSLSLHPAASGAFFGGHTRLRLGVHLAQPPLLNALMPQEKLRNPLGGRGRRVHDTVNGSIDKEELGDGIVRTLR